MLIVLNLTTLKDHLTFFFILMKTTPARTSAIATGKVRKEVESTQKIDSTKLRYCGPWHA